MTGAVHVATNHQPHRGLTGRQLTVIGLCGAIGTGLFLGSGSAISQTVPATIIAFVVDTAAALVIAWALAEMVTVHPGTRAFGTIAHSYLGDGNLRISPHCHHNDADAETLLKAPHTHRHLLRRPGSTRFLESECLCSPICMPH